MEHESDIRVGVDKGTRGDQGVQYYEVAEKKSEDQ